MSDLSWQRQARGRTLLLSGGITSHADRRPIAMPPTPVIPMTSHTANPLVQATRRSTAAPRSLASLASDALLPLRSVAFVLVAILAAFMLFLGVRGFFDPPGAAHGFGIDLAASADAFYLRVKADRDLAIGVLLVVLLVYRRVTPLALVVGALTPAPLADCTLSVLDPRGHAGYALAVHGSAVLYGIVTTALLVRARRGPFGVDLATPPAPV